MTYTLIIPIYNEVRTLHVLLKKLQRLDDNIEIIIIDDGSNDGTKELLIESNQFNIIRNESNKKNKHIGILVDLPGPKIRLDLKHIGESVNIIKDDIYITGNLKLSPYISGEKIYGDITSGFHLRRSL